MNIKLKKRELNRLAKENGIANYSKMSREELQKIIDDFQNEEKIHGKVSEAKQQLTPGKELDNIVDKIVQRLTKMANNNKDYLNDITIQLEIIKCLKYEDNYVFKDVYNKLLEKNQNLIIEINDFKLVSFIEEDKGKLTEDENIKALLNTQIKYENNDPVYLYLKSIGDYPVLNAKQEQECSKIILKYVNKDNLSDIEELQLQKARDLLTLSNKGLVASIARKFQGRGLSLLDLIQEGSIGVIKAANKYDYKTGYRFSTYATWWIRQSITRALTDKSKTIRVPVHVNEVVNKITKIKRELQDKQNIIPSIDEIDKEFQKRYKKLYDKNELDKVAIIFLLKNAKDSILLESSANSDTDSTLESLIQDTRVSIEDEIESRELKDEIEKALSSLSDKEESIIRLKYGFYNFDYKEVILKVEVIKKIIDKIDITSIESITNTNKLLEQLDGYHSYDIYNARAQEYYRKVYNLFEKIEVSNKILKIKTKELESLKELSEQRKMNKIIKNIKGKISKYNEQIIDLDVNFKTYFKNTINNLTFKVKILQQLEEKNKIIKPLTLEEISNLYDISRERVRQIEKRAKEKLKNTGLKDAL